MVANLTTPFRMRHPNVQFTILSRTSIEVLTQLENLEIDAGLTYLDNGNQQRVNTVSLYREHYRLLTSSDAPLGNRATVTWAEVAQVPLCLLTPTCRTAASSTSSCAAPANAAADAQIQFDDRAVRACAHRTLGERDAGELAETLGLTETIRAIPIVAPEAVHTIGLVVPAREPMTPLTAALVAEAQRLAPELDAGERAEGMADPQRAGSKHRELRLQPRCRAAARGACIGADARCGERGKFRLARKTRHVPGGYG